MPKGRKNKKKKAHVNNYEIKNEKRNAAIKKNKKYIFPLILNTILFFALYSILVRLGEKIMTITLWTYFALTLIFSVVYIVYNRGFSRMNVTPEMLPASMSREDKEAFIHDGKVRLEKSKWMLLIIFPLLMTFILDVLGIFILEPMMSFINGAM